MDKTDFQIEFNTNQSTPTRIGLEESFLRGRQRPSSERASRFLGATVTPTDRAAEGERSGQLATTGVPLPHGRDSVPLLSVAYCPAQCQAHGGRGPREGPEAARTDVVAEGGWCVSEVVGEWPQAVVTAFPPYTIPLAFLSLFLFSLSLFPVSPALPFPPPLSYLCLRPASGPRGLCFTPLVAHRAEEAADPWYNTAWLGWFGYTSAGGSRNGLAWLLKTPSSPKI